jgi:hypothetical protein
MTTHAPEPLLRNKIVWWIVFGVATVSLSQWFQAFKVFTLVPDVANGLWLVGFTVLLIGAFVTLLYDSYVKERLKGNIRNAFSPFERLYEFQSRKGGAASCCNR